MTHPEDIFESSTRKKGDLAGVVEQDGDTCYFYLFQTGERGDIILDSIHLQSGPLDFTARDLQIIWDSSEEKVGLVIRGELWAVFDALKKAKSGGNYKLNSLSTVTQEDREGLESGQ